MLNANSQVCEVRSEKLSYGHNELHVIVSSWVISMQPLNWLMVIFAKRSPSQSKSIPIGLDVDGITFAISPPNLNQLWLSLAQLSPSLFVSFLEFSKQNKLFVLADRRIPIIYYY